MRLGLVPVPAQATTPGGWFPLDQTTAVTGDAAASALLREALHRRTGLAPADAGAGISLRIEPGATPESYRLRVDTTGAEIVGADAAGLQHGVHTLAQLVSHRGGGWAVPAIDVVDAPRFSHRGLMLDVARHFFPVEVVTRLIDRAAALKLNVLHLHLSDDQGWRLALDSRPELVARASASAALGDAGGYYTREDWELLLAHAASRHVTVVPEFDVPGHTHAAGLAYPDIARPPVITPEMMATVEEFGGGVPTTGEPYTGFVVGFSSLRIGEPATSAFLTDVFAELATLTPGPYLHIGGDEALGTSPEDYAGAVAEATGIVASLGKTPMAWHEAGGAAHPGTIGQFWGFVDATDESAEKARAFVADGGRIVLSPADAIYLDMKDADGTALGLTWANGPTSFAEAYGWDPADVVPGLAERDVLGVEAAVWTETIRTEDDLLAMVFPRLAAAAEIAWSPASARSWEGFRARMAALAEGWDAEGLRYSRIAGIDWPAS